MLRYQSKGEVHKDFHGLTCATLHYLIDNYGQDAVVEVLRNTAQKVYKSIHEGLQNGDPDELIEFWTYYLEREKGEFTIEKTEDFIRLTVKNCPALRHLVQLEQEPDPVLCEGTKIFNEALVEGSPFELTTERTGAFSCIQTLKKREEKE
ncbi:MAG: hypothetical protein IKA79_06515 [Lentisphaeria bacterium]|nr:hypothetical protein [Lentisphaeria bacterium]